MSPTIQAQRGLINNAHGVMNAIATIDLLNGLKLGGFLQGIPYCTPNSAIQNSCGIHIMSGSDCGFNSNSAAEAAALQGDNYYQQGVSSDPWANKIYRSLSVSGDQAKVSFKVPGFSLEGANAVVGKTFVAFDVQGNRISCGVIPPPQ